MSSVHVSPENIGRFADHARDCASEVNNELAKGSSAVIDVENKVKVAISNTNALIEEMVRDFEHAQKVYEENCELLEKKEVEYNAVEKQLSAARDSLEAAQEEQTRAKNSSSGSTPEEKKAHDSAVSAANSAVSSASSAVSSLKSELTKIGKVIERINRANSRLSDIMYIVKNQMREAREYIAGLQKQLRAVMDKKSKFESEGKRAVDSFNSLETVATNAKSYIDSACKSLADAADKDYSSYDNRVSMNSIHALIDAAEIMENMKESVQNFTHDQKERVQEFSDTLGDSISYHMAQVGADIGEKMVHATATFDEKAQKLRQAYKQLVAYTNIHYTRY